MVGQLVAWNRHLTSGGEMGALRREWGRPARYGRHRARGRRWGRAGVTLIELLIASVVIGIGLAGVGSIVTYGVLSHRKAVEYTIAAARATKEIEQVRRAGYLGAVVDESLFPADTYTIISATQVSFAVDELNDGLGYVTVGDDTEAQATDPDTGEPYGNMKQILVQIFWDRPGGRRDCYSAATLIANRP